MTQVVSQQDQDGNEERARIQLSLGTAAARNLATTTKTRPQMQGITTRWLLRTLPWVQVGGGTYRVNRRLRHTNGNGRVAFGNIGDNVQIVPQTLAELPALRGVTDETLLQAIANQFTQNTYQPGDVIATQDAPANQVVLIAHGKVNATKPGRYGGTTTICNFSDGDHFGDDTFSQADTTWPFTTTALTPVITLSMTRESLDRLIANNPALAASISEHAVSLSSDANAHGEAAISLASGHVGEPVIDGTFVDYDLTPREYELSIAQTVLRVHTRVADLYNQPHNQTENQLRLTIEALRERQEHEIVNNPEFGLLCNTDLSNRLPTRSGPPTPDDMDDLLAAVWKEPGFLFAHPKTIAAFGRECSKRGIYPPSVDLNGHKIPAWRGVPLLPCNKIPITDNNTTSVMAMRMGEDKQGVVGLHQVGLPDEYEPGLSVRFMNINEQAVISYLVTAYYSAAILVPDAMAVLEHVQLGRSDD